MTDGTRVVIGRSMAGFAVGGSLVGLVWLLALGATDVLWTDWVVHNTIIAVGSGLIAWMVIRSQPRNGEIWVFVWAGVLTGLEVLLYAVALQMLQAQGFTTPVLEVVPSDVPISIALVLMQVNWLWMGVLVPLTLGLLLFPDGNPPSPRWRWVFWLVIVAIGATCLGLLWEARPSGVLALRDTQDTNGGFASFTSSIVTVGYPLAFSTVILCVSGLVTRFRRSSGVERQQFRWVTWGASVAGALAVSAVLVDEVGQQLDVALVLGAIAMTVVLASFGIAIGKYRLYDIDAVISRTFVYGILAVFIGAVYVGIVVGIGYLIGAQDAPNTWLGLLATVVIAIAFQPLRRWLQRVANRVVYGRRATPYEVLSSFSQSVSAVDPDVLTQVAKSLSEGTTAESTSIWISRGDSFHCIAAWPLVPDTQPDASDISTEVTHDGHVLGRVVLDVPPGQPFPETDRRLLDQVAAGLGLALRNMQLTEDLRERVGELAASRRRVVSVQDETRRKLERDLHDGAQQRLVALKIKLGIGSAMAEKSGLTDVKAMIDTVREETDHTIDSVRDFARGIYPPLLESEGLGQALTAQSRKMPIAVTVQAAGLGRYPKEQEATVYFCVLEALQNAIKHSEAASVQVRLSEGDEGISFEVRDDGVGFDKAAVAANGLINMKDRVEAVGGTFKVGSEPGRGTTVSGAVPVPMLVS